MIPKIIHYCWLSNDPYPEKIQRCIESWQKCLPDYEIILWNYERFPRGKSKWVDQAFDNRKYAFASDYIRLYALYHCGGIYLDSDVEVLKSFDDLLDLPYFIGQENTPSGIEAATLGAEKGNKLIKLMLDRYENRPFVKKDNSFDIVPLPNIFRRCISVNYSYHVINKKSEFVYDESVVNVFAVDFFSPKSWYNQELHLTEKTYSIHHFTASWVDCKIGNYETIDSNRKQKSKISLLKKKLAILKRILRKKLLLRRNVFTISNTCLSWVFNQNFDLDYESPLDGCYISDEDFSVLMKYGYKIKNLKISFIKAEDSKYRFLIDDFFPVARVEGTNIELLGRDYISKEQMRNHWEKGLKQIQNKKIIFLRQRKKVISNYDVYILCLKVNLGFKYITV
ncbi:MAG: DUF1919 domain-containing protein [Fibrobacter sp.]|nr:DUF1919 domain-containing protein [Fibrobacter sp.]